MTIRFTGITLGTSTTTTQYGGTCVGGGAFYTTLTGSLALTVRGLTNGVATTCQIVPANALGQSNGSPSVSSASVTPTA